MERAINSSYSAFGTAGESSEISSSANVHISHGMKKSRRLSTEQARALERSFESGKILEAGRKKELAAALGLHPRQIAIWFQNRRAKWKTTQIEKDFGVLKQNYEFLKVDYRALMEENKKLRSEIQRSSNIFKNDQNKKDKQIMGDQQIDFNIVKAKKQEYSDVHNNTKDDIREQASMEENCGQKGFLAVQENWYYKMGDISNFMLADHLTPSIQ